VNAPRTNQSRWEPADGQDQAYPARDLPFEVLLDRLPSPRPPLLLHLILTFGQPRMCSITTGGRCGPARSRIGEFGGVCSNYLESNAPNSTVFAFVREPTIAFRPPDNPQLPMIMIGAGTGLAPFRGFLQERASAAGQRSSGRHFSAVLRLPDRRGRLPVLRRAAQLRGRRGGQGGRRVLP
jgi:hypothetical protein